MKTVGAFLILMSLAMSLTADEIIGVVRSRRGPIAGASVLIVGIGTDTTTSSGQFRIYAPAGTIGKKVSVQIDKLNWTLVEPYDSFIVPADSVQNPVTLVMRPSTPIASVTNAGGDSPTISISAITEAPTDPLDVEYRSIDLPNLLRIEPNVGYLDLLRQGGPISPVDWWYSPFSFHAPTLDIKVVNNTKQTVFFQEAIFEIEESKRDVSPVFFIHGYGYMELPLVNLGWGQLTRCELRFNLFSTTEPQGNVAPYKYTANATDAVNKGQFVSLDSALRDAGVDLDTLNRHWSMISGDQYTYPLPNGRSETLTKQEAIQRHQHAVGKFKDSRVVMIGEIDYVQADGPHGNVKFMAEIILGDRGPGAPAPPSMEYNVKFDVERKGYRVQVPIANALKPGDYDRFTFRIAAQQSSVHTFQLKLRYNAKRVFTSPRLQLAFFASKDDEPFMHQSNELRAVEDQALQNRGPEQ